MDVYYINLDAAADRRRSIELGFAEYRGTAGCLTRVPAVDVERVRADAVPGKIRDGEKGCLLSHRQAIELACADGRNALVVEDDAQFGPNTFMLLDKLEQMLNDYDIVFTDIGVGTVSDMVQLYLRRRELLAQGAFELRDLKGLFFFGTTAYVVNARSRDRLLALIDGLPALDLPYDLQLRHWIDSGALKAGLAFPFLTTVSGHADESDIQLSDLQITDAVCNAFRRLVWADFGRVPGNPIALLDRLGDDYFDVQTLYLARIMSVMLSPNFVRK